MISGGYFQKIKPIYTVLLGLQEEITKESIAMGELLS
jgi:hypothetical protein